MAVGLIAGSATAGAMIVLGRGLGGAGIPFAAVVSPVSPLAAAIGAISTAAVIVGALVWLLMSAAWGAVFAWLVVEWRGRTVIPGIVVGVSQFLIGSAAARASGRGMATVLGAGDRIVLELLFAAALVIGIRFAFSPHRAGEHATHVSM
jgi:hypothetical protein